MTISTRQRLRTAYNIVAEHFEALIAADVEEEAIAQPPQVCPNGCHYDKKPQILVYLDTDPCLMCRICQCFWELGQPLTPKEKK